MGILIYRSRGGHSHCLLLRWTLIVAWIISTARRRHYHCLLYRWTSVVAGIISTTRRDQYHFLLYRWTSVVTEIISTTRRDQYHLLLYRWTSVVTEIISTTRRGHYHCLLCTPNKLLLLESAVSCLLRVRSVSFTSRAKGCIKFVPHSCLMSLSQKVGVFLEEAICYFIYAKFAVMLEF
jgi:hypothetical protein